MSRHVFIKVAQKLTLHVMICDHVMKHKSETFIIHLKLL